MRRVLILLLVVAGVLLIVPGWTGEERLRLLGKVPRMSAIPVSLDPADPSRRRVGALSFVDGWELTSPDTAFGGFSAIAVQGPAVTLLSDGGNIVRFDLGPTGSPAHPRFANLSAGPGIGWDKADRDSEALVLDPVTGRSWVGFEKFNAIFRYAPGFTRIEAAVRPPAMRRWPTAASIESLARLPDGRFVAISEAARPPARTWPRAGGRGQARQGLIWPGDPTAGTAPAYFAYVTEGTNNVADAAALPDGSLLVLERGFTPPYRFSNRVTLVPAGAIRPHAIVTGRLLARLEAPLIHDNFEGIAATRDGVDTVIWLVSDDNRTPVLQRTLLLRFRVRLGHQKRQRPAPG